MNLVQVRLSACRGKGKAPEGAARDARDEHQGLCMQIGDKGNRGGGWRSGAMGEAGRACRGSVIYGFPVPRFICRFPAPRLLQRFSSSGLLFSDPSKEQGSGEGGPAGLLD